MFVSGGSAIVFRRGERKGVLLVLAVFSAILEVIGDLKMERLEVGQYLDMGV